MQGFLTTKSRSFVLAVACFIISIPAFSQKMAPFELVTGNLAPFAIENSPNAPGVLVELVEAIALELKQEKKVKFYPWGRAVSLPLTQPRTTIFPMTRTPEREVSYRWLVKLYSHRFSFLTKKGNQTAITTLENARKLKIAVLKGAPNAAVLIRFDFNKSQIFEEATIETMFRALDLGIVDILFGSEIINLEGIKTSGRNPANYETGMILEQGDIWLAGSNDFTDEDILAFKNALEAITKSGIKGSIFKKYGIKE